MTVSKDLFLSILSMDAYNRGYNPGISGLSDAVGTGIGNATLVRVSDSTPGSPEVNASVYGLAYQLTQSVGTSGNLIADQTTTISNRGTDQAVGELTRLDLPVQ